MSVPSAALSLVATDFTLTGPAEDGGLTILLTRLQPSDSPAVKEAEGPRLSNPPAVKKQADRLSILFMHGISYHKESWIPTVEYLFELQHKATISHFVIAEVWLMDALSHGHAAILNDEKLLSKTEGVPPHETARAMKVFFRSNLIKGTSLVGIAHSGSCPVFIISTQGYETDKLPYSRMVLVEPPMITPDLFEKLVTKGKVWMILTQMAKTRKDIWPSREAAREWMAERSPWSAWNPRSLDLFVEHGLRDLPTAKYPDRKGVTLSCTREQEAALYAYGGDNGFEAIDRLEALCKAIPVHVIYGENANIISEDVRKAFLQTMQTSDIASVTTIPDAGHLVAQEDPFGVALAIWGALHTNPRKSLL